MRYHSQAMQRFSVWLLRLIPAAALFMAGCVSTPPVGVSDGGDRAAPGDAAASLATAPEDAGAGDAISALEPAAAGEATPAAPPQPAPQPRPWVFRYEAGRCHALFDGVSVYLGEPAVSNWRSRTAKPTALDARATVRPLRTARSHPIATGRKMRVCLDPGHGGMDSGAVSRDGKTNEKSLALDIAKNVAAKLRADGFDVMLTRTGNDAAVELADRAAKAKRWHADMFVSIHLNSEKGGKAGGIETYAMPVQGMQSTSHSGTAPAPDSKRRFPGNANDDGNMQLAFCIHRRLVNAVRGNTGDRGLRRARWVVLREAAMPAALVECGFVSSSKDLAFLRSASGRETVARGIYEGICDFAFGTMAPGLAPRSPKSAPDAAAVPVPTLAMPPLESVQRPEDERPLDASPAVVAAREAALKAAGLTAE